MKQYTFILTASKELPKQCIRYGTTNAKYASRKNVGIRMPDDAIAQAILQKMDAPLISTRLGGFLLSLLFFVEITFSQKSSFNFDYLYNYAKFSGCRIRDNSIFIFEIESAQKKFSYSFVSSCISYFVVLIVYLCISVKWPKENEWMIDPVVIADIYGPEV